MFQSNFITQATSSATANRPINPSTTVEDITRVNIVSTQKPTLSRKQKQSTMHESDNSRNNIVNEYQPRDNRSAMETWLDEVEPRERKKSKMDIEAKMESYRELYQRVLWNEAQQTEQRRLRRVEESRLAVDSHFVVVDDKLDNSDVDVVRGESVNKNNSYLLNLSAIHHLLLDMVSRNLKDFEQANDPSETNESLTRKLDELLEISKIENETSISSNSTKRFVMEDFNSMSSTNVSDTESSQHSKDSDGSSDNSNIIKTSMSNDSTTSIRNYLSTPHDTTSMQQLNSESKKKPTIYFASSNVSKYEEIVDIMKDHDVRMLEMDIPEVQNVDVVEVVRQKIKYASEEYPN